MACQSVKRTTRTQGGVKWTLVKHLQLAALLLGEVLAIVSAGGPAVETTSGDHMFGKQGYGLRRFKSMSMSKPASLPLRRLKAPGNEIIPAVGSNDISEEPTCEELRAMWRYYKRQSRAEFTNEIPQFGKNPFFDMFPSAPHTPVVSSFGPIKGRSKTRMRPQTSYYGKVVYKPSKQRERGGGGNRGRNQKPFELVRDMLYNNDKAQASGQSSEDVGPVTTSSPKEPIVHFSPPPQSGKESSFQKLKEVINGERLREKGATQPAQSSSSVDNREYGKIVLSPPRGQDGRRANKPRELMTAFEKIRFGHADDILDEGIRPNLDVKRRSFPPHVLKQQVPRWSQQQQQQKRRTHAHPMLLLAATPSRQVSSSVLSSRYFGKREDESHHNNNNAAQTTDKHQLDGLDEAQDVSLREDNPARPLQPDDSPYLNAPGSYAVSKLSNPPETVEAPTCVEVEHDPCNQTSDCSCIGYALYRCYLNQCQILPLAFSVRDMATTSVEDPWQSESSGDIWHSEPLALDKLGTWEEPERGDVSRLNIQDKKLSNEGKTNRLTDATYLIVEER